MSIAMTMMAAGAAIPDADQAAGASGSSSGAFPIVELRQYTLHDDQRDALINLFEREFVESQEALGMKVVGTFRDLDRPNRFVWLRGFHDMDSRLAGLTAFYGGPVWQAHRDAANATMIDSDNVLLLRAPGSSAAFKFASERPAIGEEEPSGLIVATIYHLNSSPTVALGVFETQIKPRLEEAGVYPLAWFVPETEPNNFPRLPVRQGERVFVWFARYSDEDDHARHAKMLKETVAVLAPSIAREPEVLRVKPTSRSLLR
jgi:quinol monooxygenase YgiN